MKAKRNAEMRSALNSIRIEIAKSIVVVLLIIGLGIWQFEFA